MHTAALSFNFFFCYSQNYLTPKDDEWKENSPPFKVGIFRFAIDSLSVILLQMNDVKKLKKTHKVKGTTKESFHSINTITNKLKTGFEKYFCDQYITLHSVLVYIHSLFIN